MSSTHSTQKGTALITGASSGIGAVYADRLAHRGYDLILVARNGERLQTLANRLIGETGRSVQTVVADLTAKADLDRVEAILHTDSTITTLVNNAGVGAITPLLDTPVARMDDLIAINVSALTRLTYAAAPAFAGRGSGTIINIASVVAIAPEMLNGIYGASKAFVLALTQSLRRELGDKGIRVQAVLPGATATEFWSLSGRPVEHLPQEIVMTAGDMVDAALAGLDQGEDVTIPSLVNLADWQAYESARRAFAPKISFARPAPRYGVAEIATAS